MKIKYLPLLLILILSCNEDENALENQGATLKKIEFFQDDQSWEEYFYYDSDQRLSYTFKTLGSGTKSVLEYDNDRIKDYLYIRQLEDKLIFRDSIAYDSIGRMEKIYHFSINADPDYSIDYIYEFEYGDSGKLIAKSTNYQGNSSYWTKEKYTWEGNNISKIQTYHNSGELFSEDFFQYDNKINYLKFLPEYMKQAVSWSENNVVESEFIQHDHSICIALKCNPCETQYKYNHNGLPIEIISETGRNYLLEYE